jgi:EamA domain-containing membrane protein RarD
MTPPSHNTPEAEHRLGVVYGLAAYLLWGLFPLFFLCSSPPRR